MRLYQKILFFIFAVAATVVEANSYTTVVSISQRGTSFSVFQKSQPVVVDLENHFENICPNEGNVVICSECGIGGAANVVKGGANVGKNVFTVTKEGVALPKEAKMPSNYVQNPHRSSNYGVFENGKFVEKLRIDQS